MSRSLTHLPSLGLLFICWFALFDFSVMVLIYLKFHIVKFGCYLLEPAFFFVVIVVFIFLMRDSKGVDLDGRSGEEVGGIERKETVIRIYA